MSIKLIEAVNTSHLTEKVDRPTGVARTIFRRDYTLDQLSDQGQHRPVSLQHVFTCGENLCRTVNISRQGFNSSQTYDSKY